MTAETVSAPAGDVDIAGVAAAIGDRARARVLMGLLDGRALPAGVLAAEAGVSASTVSGHLARLRAANLVAVEVRGRARYYRLAHPLVAEALEAIARISPPEPIRSLRQGTRAYALRRARTCYQHLAGRLGVALMSALLDQGLLDRGLLDRGLLDQDGRRRPATARADRLAGPGSGAGYRITPIGRDRLACFGLDLDEIGRHHPVVRPCLDWSEQRHHLAGPLGTAVTARLFALGWIRRAGTHRAVLLTEAGRDGLRDTFGLPEDWDIRPPEPPRSA